MKLLPLVMYVLGPEFWLDNSAYTEPLGRLKQRSCQTAHGQTMLPMTIVLPELELCIAESALTVQGKSMLYSSSFESLP